MTDQVEYLSSHDYTWHTKKAILQAVSLLERHNNVAILQTSRKSSKMVSQYIKLTWQKPFQMQTAPEFRVEIFKRNVFSRYYKKEQTHLWIFIEYSAGYLRDDQHLILSMTSFLRGTVVGRNDRHFEKHSGKEHQSRLNLHFHSLGITRNQNLSFFREFFKEIMDNQFFLCLIDSCSFTPASEESMANNWLISVIDGQLIAQVFVIINCHQHRLTSITNINRSALQPLVFNWQILNREDFLLEVTEGYLLFWLGCDVLADHGKATI